MTTTHHNWRPMGDWVFAGLGRGFLSYHHRRCTRCGLVQTRVDQGHAIWLDGMEPRYEHFSLIGRNQRAECLGNLSKL
jgi:hypothetical protein